MRDEVPAKVLAIIEGGLLTHGKQNIYEVLERLGVRDLKEKVFDYVWEVPSGVPIFTIWAEFVAVHPISGRMFYVEDLANRTTLEGGAEMDTGQLKRTQDRRRQMEKVRDGKPFIAVLQSNVRSIDELMRNVTAKPLDRIKDSPWHVARWDEIRQRAIMVRGEAGWEPTDAEVELFINERRLDCPEVLAERSDASEQKDSAPLVTFRFPDQAHRDQVEAASMATIIDLFVSQGFAPQDVSRENRGYDIDVKDAAGFSKIHVEVKGTDSDTPGFFLTRNERACAASDPLWELAVVTNALGEPQIDRYTAKEIERYFVFEALAWRCDLKR
ncbi:DUF3883 domain-containing protein [Comamonas aquatilis]|uniref:protein NO VEIN domain-containing protein n=1 Tax=Comamonas aquatilis TaxID=1778406 RepID=UPI0039F087F4